ncbi:gastric inhibitory polypeptide [Chamaea fasciata]|uniref:gastric inhibitory polypeptide n=1 Tax=Chamaea fasciata TaxID=190680 RepID=UPI00336ADF01
MSLRTLLLLLAWLGVVCAEESPGPAVPVPLRRRYSEATLASDYSRTMDSVLKKNFVEWLLARREKKSQDIEGPFKREAEPQKPSEGQKIWDLGTPGAKNFLDWVWKNRENASFPALEGSEGLREFLEQEFLLWLVSGELCRATIM